jgi:hypothetical protein
MRKKFIQCLLVMILATVCQIPYMIGDQPDVLHTIVFGFGCGVIFCYITNEFIS